MPINAYAAAAPKAPLSPFTYDPGPLGPREVEVEVTHCGICHSDQAMLDNDWGFTAYPIVPGHEVIGTVAALGREATGLRLGQRVGVGWNCGSCGECVWCRQGHETFCAQERATIIGHHGGFADRVRADAHFAIPIPDALDSANAAPLLCGGSTVFTPLLRHRITGTQRVAVVGIGGLGHLAVQFVAKLGCEVTAISTTRAKEAEARGFGATDFLATNDPAALKRAADRFDVIIDTVPASLPWGDYLDTLRPEGKFIIVGVPDADLKFSAFSLIGRERAVVGGRIGSPSEIAAMLDFAARHGVHAQIEKFPLRDINAAIARVRSGQMRYRVVLEA